MTTSDEEPAAPKPARRGPIPYQLMWDLCIREAEHRDAMNRLLGFQDWREAERVAFERLANMVALFELHEKDIAKIVSRERRDPPTRLATAPAKDGDKR